MKLVEFNNRKPTDTLNEQTDGWAIKLPSGLLQIHDLENNDAVLFPYSWIAIDVAIEEHANVNPFVISKNKRDACWEELQSKGYDVQRVELNRKYTITVKEVDAFQGD